MYGKAYLINSISTKICANKCIMRSVIHNRRSLREIDYLNLYELSCAKAKFIEEKCNNTTYENQTHLSNKKLLKYFYESYMIDKAL